MTLITTGEAVDNNQNEREAEPDINVEKTNTRNNTKRSWAWAHFVFDDVIKKACCNYCKALIICNKGSTSGLISHLKNKHNLTKEKSQQRQPTLHEVINNSAEPVVSIMIKHLLFVILNMLMFLFFIYFY